MESQSWTRLSIHTISKQILTDTDILHPSRISHAQACVSLAMEGPKFSTMASFSVLSMGPLFLGEHVCLSHFPAQSFAQNRSSAYLDMWIDK